MRTGVLAAALLALATALPAAAQTTLGTIRGTIYDPQENVVPGATVVVTDESTSVTRETQTDPKGSFEVSNLRPGTYTVTATLSGFKKVERTGVVLRAASVARADFNLEVGGLEDVVTVTAEGQNNITIESQSIARGLDEQQLRDLPRNSRDVQDFLMLNPNVVGDSTASSFSAAAPTAPRTSRTGSPRAPASSASSRTRRPASMRSRRSRSCRTRTAPSTAVLPASSSRPSFGRVRTP